MKYVNCEVVTAYAKPPCPLLNEDTVGFRFNAVQYNMILRTSLLGLRRCKSEFETTEDTPELARYVSFVRIRSGDYA